MAATCALGVIWIEQLRLRDGSGIARRRNIGHAVAIASVAMPEDGARILPPYRVDFIAIEVAQVVEFAVDLLGVLVALVFVDAIQQVARDVPVEELFLRARGLSSVVAGGVRGLACS